MDLLPFPFLKLVLLYGYRTSLCQKLMSMYKKILLKLYFTLTKFC